MQTKREIKKWAQELINIAKESTRASSGSTLRKRALDEAEIIDDSTDASDIANESVRRTSKRSRNSYQVEDGLVLVIDDEDDTANTNVGPSQPIEIPPNSLGDQADVSEIMGNMPANMSQTLLWLTSMNTSTV